MKVRGLHGELECRNRENIYNKLEKVEKVEKRKRKVGLNKERVADNFT